jgi:hypothetical protein
MERRQVRLAHLMKRDLRGAGDPGARREGWQLRLRATKPWRVRRGCFGVEPRGFDRLGATRNFDLGRRPLFILRRLTNSGPDVVAVRPHRRARVGSRR